MKKIGFITDFEDNNKVYNIKYTIRKNYLDLFENAGALPIILPYSTNECIFDEYVNMLDGLIFIGGDDLNPKFLHQDCKYTFDFAHESRTKFEIEMFIRFLKTGKPIIGICYGMQFINFALGGTIIEDIPRYFYDKGSNDFLNHKQNVFYNNYEHKVIINPNTLLHKILDKKEIEVNSTHHQAVDRLADGLEIAAFAKDGILECYNHKFHNFLLGIQWHPEKLNDENSKKIAKAFIDAC